MEQRTIVIVGGAHGGPTAASFARQYDENARIVLLEKSPHVAWIQADLRYHLEGDLTLFERYLKEKEDLFSKRYRVEVHTDTEAVGLDMDAKCVEIQGKDGFDRIGFDAVIFAGGAVSKRHDIDGLSGPNVSNFRNLVDVRKIRESITAGAKKAVVLGCGFFGLDAAQALHAEGLDVTIVEKAPRVLHRFSLPQAKSIERKLFELGIRLCLSDQVVSAKKREGMGLTLSCSSGRKLETDIVVVTIGSRPRTDLLLRVGAALQKDGSVRVSKGMATTLPNVFACGSAVSVVQALTRERWWWPQPSLIERTAQIAGQNAGCGGEVDGLSVASGTHLLEVGGEWFSHTGLSESEARLLFDEENILLRTVHGESKEVWYGHDDLSVQLLVEKGGGRIVGGEVWGKNGVSRRIDLLSFAVLAGLTTQELVDFDMAYAGHLGPAFDPLREAAQLAKSALSGGARCLSGDTFALWMAKKKPFTWIDVSKEKPDLVQDKGGILHIPLERLREKLSEVDSKRPIVVSSQSGRRAFLAQQLLSQRGFLEVYQLDGGVRSWSLMMDQVWK